MSGSPTSAHRTEPVVADSARPLRILLGCDTFAPDINGAASFAQRLAVALTLRGHDVHVAAPAPTGVRAGVYREEYDGVTITAHRWYSWRWPPHPWLRFALPWRAKANGRATIAAVQPDVLHFQSHIVVGGGLVGPARKAGIRIIGTNHTMPENLVQHVPFFLWFIVRWMVAVQWRSAARVYGHADVVTTPTRRSSDYFEAMTGLRGVHAISNGIDAARYTPDYSPRTENRIVFVGRLDEEKHIDELLRATAKLPAELDARVDIVGIGDERDKLERLAHTLGVDDRVTFHGKVDDDELRGILTRGAVFAMPSRAELQCIAAMEAMASALPVVAANAMALPHLVHEGENGYLFEPGDIDGFAAHLATVLSSAPADYERMKRASQKIVSRHSLEATVELFERMYRGESVVDPDPDLDTGPVAASRTTSSVAPMLARARAMLRRGGRD